MLKVLGGEQEGEFKAVASGTLPNGKPVVVNADGTVSVISGSDASVGSETVFEAAESNYIRSVFDSANNKVVIAYSDNGNSSYGTAVVGTVSGDSISFGSPVVFESTSTIAPRLTFDTSNNKVVISYTQFTGTDPLKVIVGTVSGTSISFGSATTVDSTSGDEPNCCFDSNSNKVVVSWRDGGSSNYGKVAVGTVSGASISFGTEVTFLTNYAGWNGIDFDSNSNKVVIAYYDGSNSGYGTAIVGTVSGTSISFGTPVVYASSGVSDNEVVFDTNSNKIVISYDDDGNSSYGTAVVGTVSGTSISFGTPVVFNQERSFSRQMAFDSNTNKVLIAYEDRGNSSYGTVIGGTVSGNSISFDSPYVFNASTTTLSIGLSFDSNANKAVISYRDSGNSTYGTSVVYAPASTNLTAENYIGISSGGAVADTANATVDIIGTVNKDQTGLTAGQKYYVQTDGTLSTTAGSPSVLAGTAISSTKLLVKT